MTDVLYHSRVECDTFVFVGEPDHGATSMKCSKPTDLVWVLPNGKTIPLTARDLNRLGIAPDSDTFVAPIMRVPKTSGLFRVLPGAITPDGKLRLEKLQFLSREEFRKPLRAK